MIDKGEVRPGTTIVVPFHTFDSNDPSASVTITGLAITDIEIYKGVSMTQRASTTGYVLIDTDGIDIDGTTGIHGVSIDLSSNATAGFYSAGSQYTVVIASITVDAATVNFIPVTFTIGYPNALINTTIATLSTQTSFTLTDGPAEADALNGMWAIIHDVASKVQLGHVLISDYAVTTKTVTLAAGATFTAVATDNISIMGLAPLQPTVIGNTLDVTSTGAAGIDWANVENPTTALDLSGTDIQLVDTVTTYTGNTLQTGDNFARLGAPAGASVSADVAAVKVDSAAILVDTADIQPKLGTPAADVSADIAAMKVDTAAILVDTAQIGVAGAGLTDITLNAASVDLIWDEVLTGATHNVVNSSGRRLRQVSAIIFSEGTAQAGGGSNSIVLEAGAITLDDEFNRAKIVIVGGLGAGQEAIITDSVASTDTLTVTPAWPISNPDATTEYEILPAQVHATVRNGGYDNGYVYVDLLNGSAGTEKGVNGTSTNPSSVLADAYTIAAQENITKFFVMPGSALTLPSDSSGFEFNGSGYTLALNGQEIGDSTFFRAATVAGIGIDTGGGQGPNFTECGIGTVTLPPCTGINCGFFGTFTIGSVGNFTFGASSEVFNLSLTLDYGAALNASQFYLVGWTGGNVEIQNAGAGTGSYTFDMNGIGDLTVNANCSATTTVTLRGNISRNADISGVTYVEIANSITQINDNETKIDAVKADTAATLLDTADMQPKLGTPAADVSADIAAVKVDTAATLVDTAEIGTAGAGLTDLGGMSTGMQAEVNAEALDVLVTDTHAEPAGIPAATASLKDKIGWIATKARNKITQTATTQLVRNDADDGTIATSTVSDDTTTAIRGEYS